MYEGFYGLRDLPFELTPDTNYLFLTPHQREALSTLQYGLSAAKPLTLLVGDAGTGKTTLIWAALESDRCRGVRCVLLNNPVLTTADFIRMLAARFKLTPAAAESKFVLLEELEQTLRERRARGEITALVVDEAQSLTPGLLEEIRLLANIETGREKLLPLVLAGQPEVAARLEEPSLRQLKQRVTLRCELRPFTLPDTAAYIGSRVTTAGGVPSKLFTHEAVQLVHAYSRGIARTINVICDNALVTGMALRRQPVDGPIILEVCRDLSLRKRGSAPATSASLALDDAAFDSDVEAADAAPQPSRAPLASSLRAPAAKRFALRSWFRRNSDPGLSHVVIE